MAKLKFPIHGVADGEIYPRAFASGEECPAELEEHAREIGALSARKAAKPDAEGQEPT